MAQTCEGPPLRLPPPPPSPPLATGRAPKISAPGPPKIKDIQKLVAGHFNVSRGDILSARRTASVVRPRQIAMYLSKFLTQRTLPEIGPQFGGRDHTTILYGVRKITALVETDKELAAKIETLKEKMLLS